MTNELLNVNKKKYNDEFEELKKWLSGWADESAYKLLNYIKENYEIIKKNNHENKIT
jgi:hypothetical protein